MNEPAPGFALAADDGERLSFAGGNFVIRASAETTGGAFSIVEEAPPMLDTPLHDHANEDELFYILEGEHVVSAGRTSSGWAREGRPSSRAACRTRSAASRPAWGGSWR